MFDYEGMATYDIYVKQAKAVIHRFNPGYERKLLGNQDLFNEIVHRLMVADWKFDKSKGTKQSTYRLACIINIMRGVEKRVKYKADGNSEHPIFKNLLYYSKDYDRVDNKDMCENINWGKLPENYRQMIILRFMHGKQYTEIARQFNLSDNRVKDIIHKYLPRLQKINRPLAEVY